MISTRRVGSGLLSTELLPSLTAHGPTLTYVACHSASLDKNEAEAMFARIMDDVQAALAFESGTPVEAVPHADLIRIRSYYYLKSGAQIDIGLVVYPSGKAQPLYGIRVYGWMRF
jgi:hypothetical protein